MKTRNLTICAMMLALLIVFSQFNIPIGPVAITLQTFIIFLIGSLLSPRDAFITTSAYLLLGVMGVPIFTGFNGGLHSFMLPTFGFILSWIPAATLQAFYLEKLEVVDTRHIISSMIINFVITYVIGLVYMAIVLSAGTGSIMKITEILWIGLIPFIPGDLLKIIVATMFAKRLRVYFKGVLA